MKKLICIFFIVISLSGFSQQRLLTKRIIYTVEFVESEIQSSAQKDSIVDNYIVNKRFFWEAMDELISKLKNKKLYLTSFRGDTIQWDTVFYDLTKQLNILDSKKYSKKDVEKTLENEIRAIKFMEEWTYDPNTMLVTKKINAYCPIVKRDTISLIGDELKGANAFVFELGWIRQKEAKPSENALLLTRNIQYTMPIYNPKPYSWWDSNLEAEYSVPFFDMLFDKTEKSHIECWESPDAVQPLLKNEIEKRKKHSVSTTIVREVGDDDIIQSDTSITMSYTADDIDHLRFGEEILFDKGNLTFYKNVNYFAPTVRIFLAGGEFIGFYPIYYIRKR